MCGICGRLNFDERPIEATVIQKMCGVLAHRGPDDEGIYLNGSVGLGHRRLSIIDLETGHQPMSNESGEVWIVFNGEIYNFTEIKGELELKGYRFQTKSDTEVILRAYEEYGVEALNRLRGMFAFVIWNEKEKSLFLARDRLGIKPLYFYFDKKKLVFASEIKGILADHEIPREIDEKGLNNFFSYGHSVAPHTIYRGIEKLLPGHYLICRESKVQIREYWDCKDLFDSNLTEGEASLQEEGFQLLKGSVQEHLVSDVPLGAFLSGGLDSSLVVGLMTREMEKPVKTFSVGFESKGRYNELDDAQTVAEYFGTDHHELVVASDDLLKTLDRLIYHYDEPFGDAASIPVCILSEFARSEVKVVLTGEGGDEVFGGYRRYWAEAYSEYYRLLPEPLRKGIGQGVSLLPRFRRLKKASNTMGILSGPERYGHWLIVFDREMRKNLFSPELWAKMTQFDEFEVYRKYYLEENPDLVNRIMYVDQKTWLPDDYLEKMDKATMAVGLEARVPFLDHRLIEFSSRVPSRYKVRGMQTKHLLKRIAKGILPEQILKKPKHGFAVPTDPWFRGELKDFVYEVLFDPRTKKRDYFNPKTIEKIYKAHLDGREVNDSHLWLLLNFELWHRRFMD
jgi:asparagine synthase (glutamine-hydrolysing)